MEKSVMSVESISMVDMYVTYCPEEDTWHVKCNMEINGAISYDNWMKLLEKRNSIVDSENRNGNLTTILIARAQRF